MEQFSADWFSAHGDTWKKHLAPLSGKPIAALEVGSFEGRSAVFFLDHFRLAKLICIDTFEDYYGFAGIEARFDANVKRFGDRVRKIKGRSAAALDGLIEKGHQFDFIYVDGSHERDDVMIDSLLAWKLLRPGGFMIWDDYGNPEPELPQRAIDDFFVRKSNELQLLRKDWQVIARRI